MPAGDKGKGKRGEKGLKSAEVGRPPATPPAAEDGAGELEADGGKVTQQPPPPPSLCGNAFLYRRLPLFLIPLHVSHKDHSRRLTDALTQNDRISFTSTKAEYYKQEGQRLQRRQRILEIS